MNTTPAYPHADHVCTYAGRGTCTHPIDGMRGRDTFRDMANATASGVDPADMCPAHGVNACACMTDARVAAVNAYTPTHTAPALDTNDMVMRPRGTVRHADAYVHVTDVDGCTYGYPYVWDGPVVTPGDANACRIDAWASARDRFADVPVRRVDVVMIGDTARDTSTPTVCRIAWDDTNGVHGTRVRIACTDGRGDAAYVRVDDADAWTWM